MVEVLSLGGSACLPNDWTIGHYERLMAELQNEDVVGYKNIIWMTLYVFHELLLRVAPEIKKNETFYRKAINSRVQELFQESDVGFLCCPNTISKIVREGFEAIMAEYAKRIINFQGASNSGRRLLLYPQATGILSYSEEHLEIHQN